MSDQRFERFDGDPCAAVLPVNTITDEFELFRFVSLRASADPTKAWEPSSPYVLPLSLVNPTLFESLQQTAGTEAVARAGVSLSSTWENVTPGEVGAIPTVAVTNINQLLASRKVTVGDEQGHAQLTPANVQELQERGQTVATVSLSAGRKRVLIRNELPRDTVSANQAVTIELDDASRFIATPQIRLPTGEIVPVTLSAGQIGELRASGGTQLQLRRKGGGRTSVFVRALPQAQTGGTGTDTTDGIPKGGVGPGAGRTGTGVGSVGGAGNGTATGTDGTGTTSTTPPIPSLEFVLYVPYTQTWELLGYSRGALVNSFSLAPQEQATIEIFTWDRTKRVREESVSTEDETTRELGASTKDTAETLRQMTSDLGWKYDVGGKISLPVKEVTGDLGGNIDVTGKLEDIAKTTNQSISDASEKTTTKVRSTRQVKVEQTEEFGSEQRVTRKITNPNMCHTLNLDYFEILAGYTVTTALDKDRLRLCVLTPNLIQDTIDRQFLLVYEGALRKALVSPVYLGGFDAAHTLAAHERVCELACAATCLCGADVVSADPASAATALLTASEAVIAAIESLKDGEIGDLLPFAIPVTPPTMHLSDALASAGAWLYRETLARKQPKMWQAALDFAEVASSAAEAAKLLDIISPDDVDSARLPIVASATTLGILAELPVTRGAPYGVLIAQIALGGLPIPKYNDCGFAQSLRRVKPLLDIYNQAQLKKQKSDDTKAAEQQAAIQTALNAFPVDQLAKASVDEQALIHHILQYEAYYRNAVWKALDLDDRFAALSLAGALTTYVDNDVVGFVGDRAALPISLDAAPTDLQEWYTTNVTGNAGLQNAKPVISTQTLPTTAVTLEARLGACDACEDFIQQSRQIELERLKAVADQQKSEATRYQQRVSAGNLDDPDPDGDGQTTVRVLLDQSKQPAPT